MYSQQEIRIMNDLKNKKGYSQTMAEDYIKANSDKAYVKSIAQSQAEKLADLKQNSTIYHYGK